MIRPSSDLINYLSILVLVVSTPLFADTRGKVSGTVTAGESGAPLPGVNVFIPEHNLGAITNEDGFYSILNIPPGKHTVSASFIGYKTHTVQGVLVASDQTTNIDFVMTFSVLEGEEVVVTAEKPLVQADQTSTRSIITEDDLKALPNETFQSLLSTKAGVTVGSDGALHVRGGRSSEVLYMLDGIPVVNPFSSGLGLTISTNMIAELTLISGTFNAEYGRAMSGVVNLVTRDGGSHLDGSVRYQSGDMYSGSDEVFDDIGVYNPFNFNRTDLSFSGPVPLLPGGSFLVTGTIEDNNGWLYGYRAHNTWDFASLNVGSNAFVVRTGDSAQVAMNRNASSNFMGKVTMRPWSSSKLTFQHTRTDRESQDYSHAWKFNPNGRSTLERRNRLYALHFSQTLSEKSYFTIKLARRMANSERYVHKLNMPYDYDENIAGRDLDGDGKLGMVTIDWDFIREHGAILPNDTWYTLDVESRYVDENAGWYDIISWNADSTIATIAVPHYVPYDFPSQTRSEVPADHFIYGSQQQGYSLSDYTTNTLKFDFTSQISRAHQIRFGIESNLYKLHSNGMSIILTASNNWQPWIPSIKEPGLAHDEYTREPFDFAAYVQDKIELENVIIQAGLRFDYFDANDSTFSDHNNPVKDGVATPKMQVSPRFGVSFPITDQGFIRFSYGHFFQMPGFTFLYRNPDLKTTSNSYLRFGNPDLEPQRNVMYEIGLQQQLTATTAIDVTMFYRNILNWLSSQYYFIDNELRYTQYITRDYGNIRGFTVAFIQRARTGLAINVDYTLQFAEGNASSADAAFYDNQQVPPIESEKKVVPLSWDVRNSLNGTLSYRTVGGLGISLISKFATGLPYTPTTTQGIRDSEENAGRRPVNFTVDLQVYKSFEFGGQAIQATIKIYNMFDRLNERTVFTDTGRSTYSLRPNYAGDPAEIYPELAGKGIYSIEERIYSPLDYRAPRNIRFSLGWSF